MRCTKTLEKIFKYLEISMLIWIIKL